ncbi:hypothetical protein T01_2536 [Trichinella spiralis]|uniref:Uncharacterized protein n=1 Tax=Trichinella spiralis TaxID=6334 RepID=A0A0V1BDZ9_TRISP|nr:hypothetical protein T01_2536 [Trichinella spiralis]
MHKNRFPALRYANNDRHKRCLIVSKGALVRLTYVASGSVVKCSLNMNNEEKSQNADGMKQNKEGEKNSKEQNFHIMLRLEVPMHKNRFPALRYANNDRHKGALSSVRAHSFFILISERYRLIFNLLLLLLRDEATTFLI